MTFVQRIGKQGVPLVLDWAIRDSGGCPPGGSSGGINGNTTTQAHGDACVSAHSYCLNATNGPGYFCKCSQGYAGNPYVSDGCQNVNECDPSIYKEKYPCIGGTCHDIEATICAISILAILLIFLHMKCQKRKLQYAFDKNGGQLLKNIGIKIYQKKEIIKITNNYDNKIGEGAFGRVYKGTTDDNKQKVAVKCPKTDTDQHNKKPNTMGIINDHPSDFANEVTMQFHMSHKNVVRLLGCCLETNAPMLVYEFIPKGSLEHVLHGKNLGHALPLQTRLGIAIESAEALAYMHSSANQKILHGDVKSGNILLDDNFMPKISDFGISRLLSIEKDHASFVIGDTNYMDPVYMQTGLLTEKSDVYSFGIVLLELITRKKPRYDGNKSLPLDFVKSYKTENKAREMLDDEIITQSCTEVNIINCLEIVSGIAVQCLEQDVDKRPNMKEVSNRLSFAREVMQEQGKRSSDQADEIAIAFPSPLSPI
uniref:Protein kinase domain-containing protein n=1 Tax=Oryza brachyantha TaxID=4533 RepID=J3N908_ORYBR